MRDHPTLLVLDNFEQVLDAAPLVADLLASVAALRVLVTSRAPLRVRGEREYVVGPLALDADVDEMSPADLARAPAVRLFVERVRDVQPDFRLTSSNSAGNVVATLTQAVPDGAFIFFCATDTRKLFHWWPRHSHSHLLAGNDCPAHDRYRQCGCSDSEQPCNS